MAAAFRSGAILFSWLLLLALVLFHCYDCCFWLWCYFNIMAVTSGSGAVLLSSLFLLFIVLFSVKAVSSFMVLF